MGRGSSYLAGITLEIDGNVSPLTEAMKDVNKSASDLQDKLNAVNQALKFDPKNADLLEQKEKLLGDAISANKEKLEKLQEAQRQFIAAKKDVNSREYIELEKQIAKTESKIKDLKNQQTEMTSGLKKFSDQMDKLSSSADKFSQKTAGLSKAAGGLITSFAATVPLTDELRQDLSFLEQNAADAGVSVDTAKNAFNTFNNVINETDSSVEGVSNLLQAGFTESNLQKAVEGLTGAYIKFPDTMKIESLADSLQETLATGEATGQFAELLDRLGIGAESFSEELAECTTEAEKQNFVLKKLANAGLNDTYNEYKKNNKEMLESRQATQDFQESLADLAKVALPVVTEITDKAADLVEWFTKLDPAAQQAIGAVVGLVAVVSPAAKVVSNVSGAVSSLSANIVKASDGTGILSTATNLLSGHWGIAVAAAGALVAGVVALTAAFSEGQNPIVEYGNAIRDAKSAMEEIDQTKVDAIKEGQAEANYYQNLKAKLDAVVDANGNVKEGYEDIADTLVNELNKALGTHMELIDGTIQGYQDASEEMDVYIEKMKAQEVIDAQKEALDASREAREENLNNIVSINTEIEEFQKEHDQRMAELREQNATDEQIRMDGTLQYLEGMLEGTKMQRDEMLEIEAQYAQDEAIYYDNLKLMREGNLESLKKINQSELIEQREQGESELDILKSKHDRQKAEVDALYIALENTKDAEQKKLLQSDIEAAEEELEQTKKNISAQEAAIKEGSNKITNEWAKTAISGAKAVGAYDKYYAAGADSAKGYADGVGAYAYLATTSLKNLAFASVDTLLKGLDINSPSRVMRDLIGKNLDAGIGAGVEKNEKLAIAPLEKLAQKIQKFDFGLSPEIDGQFTKVLQSNSTITLNSPIQIDLDGKPIYNDVVTRITKAQGFRSQFKGVMH